MGILNGTPSENIVQPLKLGQADGCLHVGHAVIEAGDNMNVALLAGHSMITVDSQTLFQVRVLGEDHPPLSRGHDLVCKEAIAGHDAKSSCRHSVAGRRRSFCDVLDHRNAVTGTNFHDPRHVRCVTERMNDDQGLGFRRYFFLD